MERPSGTTRSLAASSASPRKRRSSSVNVTDGVLRCPSTRWIGRDATRATPGARPREVRNYPPEPLRTMSMLKRESMDRLTTALSLPATGQEQDWDVELADPARVGDFLAAYQQLPLTRDDRIARMALMLASIDRHIEAESGLPSEWERIADLLVHERVLHREAIRYWTCEGDDDPDAWFRLTPLIRDLIAR